MRILAVDAGTGTQDILLFDSSGPPESSLKLIMPSATQIAARRIRQATGEGRAVILTGVTMGGGPCHWALDEHLKAGLKAYATPDAARTFDDDLDVVQSMGVIIVSEDEAKRFDDARHIEMADLDLEAIRRALAAFEEPGDFDGLALACLDHGAAPPGYSDRLFRFDHLRRVVEERNDLRAFAYLPNEVPDYLTRARAMLGCVDTDVPVVFLDTGPAAALGALQDPIVAQHDEQLIINLGNMHALAFHLRGTHIYSLFEHHTGLLSSEEIASLSERLMAGTLHHEDVFGSHGHGVLYVAAGERPSNRRPFVAVTGPQRAKLKGSNLKPYFAVPHGDMMLSGCFGLVWAFAEKHPQHRQETLARLLPLVTSGGC
jgi:uncharacterized protein (DUF1786 family)